MVYVRKTPEEMEMDSYNRAYSGLFQIEKESDEEYIVHNLEKGTSYIVTVDGDLVTDCECPHHFYRGVLCKHMIAVSLETSKAV